MFDIKQYESWDEGDYRKTDRHLRNVIERAIARAKEDNHSGGGKPTAPTPATPAPKAKEKPKAKPKAKADAAPVLPSPRPKKQAKGKGKGKGTPRAAADRHHRAQRIRRRFLAMSHFVKKSCKKGNDCEFSHDQNVFHIYKKDGKGEGKSKSPRRTPSNTPKKIDERCWNWAKDKGKNGDSCRRRHDPHLFYTAPNTSEPASPALVRDFDSDYDAVICYKAASTTASKERVRFDMKKIDQVQYECERKSPRFKPHNKIGKSSEELKKDEQWVYTNRLATVRAKAMAIILSNADDYVNVDEVHIVIGPKIDIKIRMVNDGYGDVDEQVFVEEYIQHVPGKFGMNWNVICITVPVEDRDKKFIIDSGSGHDLIAQKKVDRMDMDMYDDEVINFQTG